MVRVPPQQLRSVAYSDTMLQRKWHLGAIRLGQHGFAAAERRTE